MPAKVVSDRVSDRSKGFGFVTFASVDEAEKAKTEMDGKVAYLPVLLYCYLINHRISHHLSHNIDRSDTK